MVVLGTSSSVSILYTTVISVGSWPAHAAAAAWSYMALSVLILGAFLGGREGAGGTEERGFMERWCEPSFPGGVRSSGQVCVCLAGMLLLRTDPQVLLQAE